MARGRQPTWSRAPWGEEVGYTHDRLPSLAGGVCSVASGSASTAVSGRDVSRPSIWWQLGTIRKAGDPWRWCCVRLDGCSLDSMCRPVSGRTQRVPSFPPLSLPPSLPPSLPLCALHLDCLCVLEEQEEKGKDGPCSSALLLLLGLGPPLRAPRFARCVFVFVVCSCPKPRRI